MSNEYISLEAAIEVSGLHPNTLRRLLREGAVRGRKTVLKGQARWHVSTESLRQYLSSGNVFQSQQSERPPRLRPRDES